MNTKDCFFFFLIFNLFYHTYLINITKSTYKLIQVLHTIKPNYGILASLDVENLFTNVPVNETIDIIIDNIYKLTLTYFRKFS